MPPVRLRQVVLAARELAPVAAELRAAFGLGEPYADPGVGGFGLENAVFALGDQFIEVVSPLREDTAAGRQLDRLGGDGGYMLIFQLADLAGARARADELAIRSVWELELPDIATVHLHPRDIGGAIVSLDRPQPLQSWRWGGPDWTGKAGQGAPGRVRGAAVAVPDPIAVATRWARVLGVTPRTPTRLAVEDATIDFIEGERGLCGITLELPAGVRGGTDRRTVGGVAFTLEA